MPPHLDVIRNSLDAIERNAPFDEVALFFSPDVVQQEFPTRFVPEGATRSLNELREEAQRGRAVIKPQSYQVLSSVCEGDRVALGTSFSRLSSPGGNPRYRLRRIGNRNPTSSRKAFDR